MNKQRRRKEKRKEEEEEKEEEELLLSSWKNDDDDAPWPVVVSGICLLSTAAQVAYDAVNGETSTHPFNTQCMNDTIGIYYEM